jgi:hypothetical protein
VMIVVVALAVLPLLVVTVLVLVVDLPVRSVTADLSDPPDRVAYLATAGTSARWTEKGSL